jgi:hypothetical protein
VALEEIGKEGLERALSLREMAGLDQFGMEPSHSDRLFWEPRWGLWSPVSFH